MPYYAFAGFGLGLTGAVKNKVKEVEAKKTEIAPVSTLPSRPYYMGVSNFPPEAVFATIDEMYTFNNATTDIAAAHQLPGVPWVKMLTNATCNKLQDEWNTLKSKFPGRPWVVSLNALNSVRDGLALNYEDYGEGTENDSGPLSPPWDTATLNSSIVKQAYLNYVKKAIVTFDPMYLNIGIEVNELIMYDINKWNAYLELHQYIYGEIKALYPNLPVSATVQYNKYRALTPDSASLGPTMVTAVSKLVDSCDNIPISTYPYAPWATGMTTAPDDFFDALANLASQKGKRIAIGENGYPSHDFTCVGTPYSYNETQQAAYTEWLLNKARTHNFLYVLNFISTDIDIIIMTLPEGLNKEAAKAWMYLGYKDSNRALKKSYTTWMKYLNMPKK